MKFPIKTASAVVGLLIILAVVYSPLGGYWKAGNRANYRVAEVTRGSIVSVVNSTGTVQPVVSVSVGSFVSGPIQELFVDFNAVVKKDQTLATIDRRIYEANMLRDKALLATKVAERMRVEALLEQAKNDEARAVALRKENEDFISDTEMDQFKFTHLSLKAQQAVAIASVESAQASLDNSQANLEYCNITSPVEGVIINRKIDRGQTLAAQFQTPELFVVAPDLRTQMHILASVDEADIGRIQEAERKKLPVQFTVDAHPDDLFEGKIFQIRMSSTTTQNVVTYPVIVTAPNPDLKLLPGMTASISFQVDEAKGCLRIPNAALRFFPPRELVRPEDRPLLDGVDWAAAEQNESASVKRSATEKAEARRNRNRRHVWVEEGDYLKAVAVVTGMSDVKYTQLVSGDLAESQKLVIGIQPPQ